MPLKWLGLAHTQKTSEVDDSIQMKQKDNTESRKSDGRFPLGKNSCKLS